MRVGTVGGFLALSTSAAFANAQAPAMVDATAAAEKAPPVPSAPALISVGTSGDDVTLAKILNRSVGSGYASGVSVLIVGITYKDLCVLPCSVKLDPGLHELSVYGPGMTGATEKFNLQPGSRHFLEVRPGSSALAMGGWVLGSLGLFGMIFGGVFLIADADSYGGWALPMTLGGVALTGGGIGMVVAGQTAFEEVSAPAQTARTHAPFMLRYPGRF